jgi:hypothetical protein
MRRLSSTEWSGLILGIVLIAGGAVTAIKPKEGFMIYSSARTIPGGAVELISKDKRRIYGVMAVLAGGGIGALSIYPWRRR